MSTKLDYACWKISENGFLSWENKCISVSPMREENCEKRFCFLRLIWLTCFFCLHSYVIVENLRYMLSSLKPTTPIYFGCRFKPFTKQGYMSGGAGKSAFHQKKEM